MHFPLYSTLCYDETKQEINTLKFSKNWKILGIVLNIYFFQIMLYSFQTCSQLGCGVDTADPGIHSSHFYCSKKPAQPIFRTIDSVEQRHRPLSSMFDLRDASKCWSECYHGQRFYEFHKNKREQTKRYCMNIHLCGHVHFIHVAVQIQVVTFC